MEKCSNPVTARRAQHPVQDKWVDVAGLRVHYRLQPGDGPAVICLPGGLLDSSLLTWKYTLQALPTHYRALALDLPGYGQSTRPAAPYTTDFYIDFLRRFMDALELERAHILASSMGGVIALGLALRQPHRIHRLVLSGAYGVQPRLPLHPLAYAACRIPGLALAARKTLQLHPRLLRLALRIAVYQPDRITDELVTDARAGLRIPHQNHLTPLEASQAWMRREIGPRRVRTDFTGQLPSLHRPVLLLHGSHDWMLPARYTRQAARSLPRAQLHIFKDCGHLVPRERPQEVNQLINAFLA